MPPECRGSEKFGLRRLAVPQTSEGQVLVVEEAARLHGIGRTAPYEAARRGQTPSPRLGTADTCQGHSALGLHTPASVHFGTAPEVRSQRTVVLDAAYHAHPERFTKPPTPPRLPTAAWINRPNPEVLIQTKR